ncbi:MAG: hypothetical protein U0T69_13515 [Chitinophagales bacterium]
MDSIGTIVFITGISILVLSFIYYVVSLFKMALFEPLINFIKIKIGLPAKNQDEIYRQDPEDIISEKHGKFLRGILDFFKGFQ